MAKLRETSLNLIAYGIVVVMVAINFLFIEKLIYDRQEEHRRLDINICQSSYENRIAVKKLITENGKPLPMPPTAPPEIQMVINEANLQSAKVRESADGLDDPPDCAETLNLKAEEGELVPR